MSVSRRILVVDDEQDILEIIRYNLKNEGFNVYTTDKSSEAFHLAKKLNPDLIMLDVMMPEISGLQLCKKIKADPDLKSIPVVLLTARGEEYSEIEGFNSGADDYITKPVRPKLIITRINALLRRNRNKDQVSQLNVGEFKIDRETFLVYKGPTEISLPKKEFELLFLLASAPGKVFSRDEVLEKVWGENVYVGERTVDVHIRKIREKIGEDHINTIKGVGYKFVI